MDFPLVGHWIDDSRFWIGAGPVRKYGVCSLKFSSEISDGALPVASVVFFKLYLFPRIRILDYIDEMQRIVNYLYVLAKIFTNPAKTRLELRWRAGISLLPQPRFNPHVPTCGIREWGQMSWARNSEGLTPIGAG
ncbi:MAG: hypothetical protein LBB26_03405 [Puniceicoccales bacterium]|jgi:hypothetical protein|nr:hypothetical protein [Puniceicoccales bacterium]